jgi:hypothetical protein
MFEGIRNRWKEARAAVLRREAEDLFRRYASFGGYKRYVFLSAFDSVRDHYEQELGEIRTWTDSRKAEVVSELRKLANEGWQMEPHGSMGAMMLNLYIDVQTIPGAEAASLKQDIEAWHDRAARYDLNSPGG